MVVSIEEIKEEDLEQVVSETTYANKNLYKESIDEDVFKVEGHGRKYQQIQCHLQQVDLSP